MPPAGRVFETPALIKDKKDILSRWADHFQELLNQGNPVDQSIADQMPQFPIISELDTIPSLEEISAAANNLTIRHLALMAYLEKSSNTGQSAATATLLLH